MTAMDGAAYILLLGALGLVGVVLHACFVTARALWAAKRNVTIAPQREDAEREGDGR